MTTSNFLNAEFSLVFRTVNDLINQSQNGKYGDTSGIGQLIHQVQHKEKISHRLLLLDAYSLLDE